jgi:drug/metabolite transporter (DMT)-like permease
VNNSKRSNGFLSSEILLPFIGFVIIAGAGPVAMRITLREIGPFWMGVIRFSLGAVFFWLLAFRGKLKIPSGKALQGAIFFGLLGIGLSFTFMSWGLVETSASLAAILLATVPMLTLLLSALQGTEKLTRRSVVGSLLVIVGTAVTVGGPTSSTYSLPHIGSILLGSAFLAQSTVVIKKYPPNPPLMTNAIGMTVGTIALIVASRIAGETWIIPALPETWFALAYVTIFASIISFILYLRVLQKWTASGTAYSFVIVPLVTVLVASTLSNEEITTNFVVGGATVLLGVLIGALLPNNVNTT